MTTYNKTELNGNVYEMKTNVGATPRCWKNGEPISHGQYMEEMYAYLAKKNGNVSYNNGANEVK